VTDLNGGHLVARTLKQAGVRHLFTLCGGHILPIYDGCLTEGIAVVDMRMSRPAPMPATPMRVSPAISAWPWSPRGPGSPTPSPVSPMRIRREARCC
jgi:hypothetical protein